MTVAPDFALDLFFKTPVPFVISRRITFLISHTSVKNCHVLFSASWFTDFGNSSFTTFRSKASSFMKKTSTQMLFVNFGKFLRTPFLWNPFQRLLLFNYSFCLLSSFSEWYHTYFPGEYFLGLIYGPVTPYIPS